jgi:hypothetical protein
LSYFCSLGNIRYVIGEYLKQYTFSMSYSGGSLPLDSKIPSMNSTMQAPNHQGIGNSTGSGPSILNARSELEKKITKVENKMNYFS